MVTKNPFAVLDNVSDPSANMAHERQTPHKRQDKASGTPKAQKKPSTTNKAMMDNPASEVEKPKGWQASLTLAQLKALKVKEAEEKHKQNHPPGSANPAHANTTKTSNQRKKSAKDKTPCGLTGCPVKANHGPRPYRPKEPSLPNLIKKIETLGPDASDAELKHCIDSMRFTRRHQRVSGGAVLRRRIGGTGFASG